MTRLRRWRPALLWLVLVAVLAAVLIWGGAGESIWAPAMMLPIAWLVSPLVFPRPVSHADATARAETDPQLVRIYVRPGNIFCIILRWRLRALAKQATWVDFWADPAAAQYVRSLNEGEELGPVVVVGTETVKRNPPSAWVAKKLLSRSSEPATNEDAPNPTDS